MSDEQVCPVCGGRSEMETVTEPVLVDGRIRGYRLEGFHCTLCGAVVPSIPIGKPADASPSGAR
jgi:hypothetical protein